MKNYVLAFEHAQNYYWLLSIMGFATFMTPGGQSSIYFANLRTSSCC